MINEEKKKAREQRYYQKHKDKINAKKKVYCENNKEKVAAQRAVKRQENKEKEAERNKKYKETHKEELAAKRKEKYKETRGKEGGYQPKPPRVKNTLSRWEKDKERLKRDPVFRLAYLLRRRFKQALRGNYKTGSAVRDLGCSVEFLKSYLEARFSPEMNWDNLGSVWHIDHIIPLSAFILTNPDAVKKACHYSNLQPLRVFDNISKSDQLPASKNVYLYMFSFSIY